jgi:putative polyhydroxyalkanoate system protein
MAGIDIDRPHQLGLDRARELALQWAARAEDEFGMAFTLQDEGDHTTVHFKRSGVSGSLRVTAQAFELRARLGLLLGAFRQTIEAQIEQNLDALLAEEGAVPPAAGHTPTAREAE